MKTTIICPTDFSDAAINATEYAAHLAQFINADLMLINIQRITPVAAAVSLGEGIGKDTREKTLIASNKLKTATIEINKIFKVPTTYEVDITTKSLEKTIANHGSKNTIIVMGTNGADNLTQFFFGTNTYNVIKKTECPVLIVPENSSFDKYNHILYPVIDEKPDKLILEQFYEFVKYFDSELTFLQISRKDTLSSQNQFNKLKEEAGHFFKERIKLNFKRIFSENVDDAIEDYIHENPINLMVTEAHRKNLLETMFRKKPLLATLSAIAPYPIFVVHY